MSFHFSASHTSFKSYLFAFLTLLLIFLLSNVFVGIVALMCDISIGGTSTDSSSWYHSSFTFALLLSPWILICLAFIPISKHILKTPFLSMITARKKIDFLRLFGAFFLWFLLCFCSFLLTKNDLIIANFQAEKFFLLLIISFIALPLQCLAEELFFRSFLLKWIALKIPKTSLQVLITGIVFGYLHASNPEVDTIGQIALLYYIGTGILLGAIAVIDRGIEITFGFHFANNLFAAIVVSSDWQVFQTDALFIDMNPPHLTAIDFSLTFGTQLLFLLLCWWMFWRKNAKINRIS